VRVTRRSGASGVRCELEQDDDIGTFPGVTLFTKSTAHCIKPTAVYFAPNHGMSGNVLNVVLWLHGFYVRDHKFLFRNDRARIRDQVRRCGKDVVLIAPFLGFEYPVDDTHFAGNYSVKDLATPKWGERYLNEVLCGPFALPGSGRAASDSTSSR